MGTGGGPKMQGIWGLTFGPRSKSVSFTKGLQGHLKPTGDSSKGH